MARAAQRRRSARAIKVAGLLLVDAGLVWLDNLTGPFIPFTVFYIALLYFTMTRVGSTWCYLIALISAAGHTYCVSRLLAPQAQAGFIAWQFATSFSVLSLLCVLLDRRRYSRPFRARAGVAAERPAQAVEAPLNRRNSWFTEGTDRYTSMYILISLAFLAIFVPWIHDADLLQPHCPGAAESGAAAASLARARAVIPTKTLLLAVAGGPADFDIDRSILNQLDRHLAKSTWLLDCARFDPFADAQAAGKLQTLRRIVKEGHAVAYRGPAPAEAAKCRELARYSLAVRLVEFRAVLGDILREADEDAADGGGFVPQREVDLNSALEPLPGTADPKAPAAAMDPLVRSLQSNDVVVIHDSRRSARDLETFLSLAEKNGYSFALPGRYAGRR
jgi:hypothetical protein